MAILSSLGGKTNIPEEVTFKQREGSIVGGREKWVENEQIPVSRDCATLQWVARAVVRTVDGGGE